MPVELVSTPGPAGLKEEALSKWYPMDEQLYALDGKELLFIKAQTGIEDEDELKRHIISVTKEAYRVIPFPCIRRFSFLKLRLSQLPSYDRLLKMGREHEDAILLDLGCCFGNDVRAAAVDGFPPEKIVASDLYSDYWSLSHKLFNSTPESFPATFIAGDAFDSNHLAVAPPVFAPVKGPPPDLSGLTSLNPLYSHVAAIHASSFFNEEQQVHLARALARLLSPLPGSMIFGSHAGAPQKGSHLHRVGPEEETEGYLVFCHSPESWAELWDRQVFDKGTVKVEARIAEHPEVNSEQAAFFMQWCVTRL
ncbi:hypothetical protein C8Q77DRAFT_24119 [Trametes polyzona]|nr:hypothetical protein C8Q77DRAFT_24119 [Trametes polyzona]